MTVILEILGAARVNGSVSRELSDKVVERLKTLNPMATHQQRDLLHDPLPSLNETVIGAFFTPVEQRTPEQAQLVARSDALIEEIKAADLIVIAAPLYNFGISAQLKTYFDWIARAGKTFHYTPEGRAQGLVLGKKVVVVSARGGLYAGTLADTQTAYLQQMLPFLGLSDLSFVYAEGLAMGEASAKKGLEQAHAAIAALSLTPSSQAS